MQSNDNDGEFLKATLFAMLENASAKLTADAAPIVISQTIGLMESHKPEILEIVRRYFAGEIVSGRVGLHFAVDDFVKKLIAAGKLTASVGMNPSGAGDIADLPRSLPRMKKAVA